jgi:TATA-binding protein-associated factor
MQKGTLLLASSGKEFAKPTGILSNSTEVKKARKAAMGRLGLDFLDSVGDDEMDLEKELAADVEPDADVEMENDMKAEEDIPPISPMEVDSVKCSPSAHPISATPAASSPTTSSGPPVGDDLAALSARERNRLKRKRKPGNSAFVAAPPPSSAGAKYSATPAGPSNKCAHHFWL